MDAYVAEPGPCLPTYDDMLAARSRIAPHVHRTPVLTSACLNELAGAVLFFKCENFQKAGTVRARGAVNTVFGMGAARAARGVATHGSGNHALSLCYAAARRGIPVTVVMSSEAAEAGKAAVRGYGGTIVECEHSASSREAALAEVVARSGAEVVHPQDDARVIAGHATCSKELVEDLGQLDAVIAPTGGGGMISGTCLSLSEISPATKVYAAEPAPADDACGSHGAGQNAGDDPGATVADGPKVPLTALTMPFVSRHVEDILLVEKDEIVDAMHLIWQRMKIVVEPSAAVPLAAVLKHREVFAGQRVGVIVTGGNIDPGRVPCAGQ